MKNNSKTVNIIPNSALLFRLYSLYVAMQRVFYIRNIGRGECQEDDRFYF